MTSLFLGIDIGTSSSKGVLVTAEGEILATHERGHALSLPFPGWVEHDAESVWWEDFQHICRDLLSQASAPVAAICISGIGPCFLAANKQGQPLRPAILYGIDTRATREIEELTQTYGAAQILERCGSPLTSQSVGPKLLWLRRNEPEVWQNTRQLLMASSFIVQRLTNQYVLDHHSASQCDPLYAIHENRWITTWAEEIAPGLELPRLLWPAEIAGYVTPEAAALTGLPAGIPVAAGTIDAWSEALSAGVSEPGDLMLMYGTTMFLVEVHNEVRIHPSLWSTAGVFAGTHTLAAGMSTSGALTAWLRQIVGDLPYETLLAEAQEVQAGSDGLVVLPYFAGERTPIFDPQARGLILGLTLRHGRGHLYRALLEATAYGIRHILEIMSEAGGNTPRLVAVGGGTRGGLWTQIVSDVLGLPQDIPAKTIGACYGDAFLAALASGLVQRDTRWNPITIRVQPDSTVRPIYDELYSIYRQLYPATLPQAHQLATLQEIHAHQ
ncbi:MAG TPA: FGGY-family carbohydrate kinase [Ktedonobacteraceae bacterium]|nr:FGGY-family carbohydrate kinase [Ktedonobacteraceae bacterium]